MSLRTDIDAGAEQVGESVVAELPADDATVSERIDAVVDGLENTPSALRETLSERLSTERRASEPPRVSD